MREKPKDNERLHHMLEAIDNIFEFVAGKTFDSYKKDKILRFAIIKNLEIIGEAAYCYQRISKVKMMLLNGMTSLACVIYWFMVITK